MSYTQVFGGNNIYPSDASFLHIDLSVSVQLDWPTEAAAPLYPLARIIDVMATAADLSLTLPNATQSGPGQVVLFNNLTGSVPCFVRDFGGNIIATLGVGEQWEFYLVDNTSSPGIWHIFQFGASTATVQPSALAGYGLTVTGSTLSQSIPVNTFNSSPHALLDSDRASAYVWTGSGSGVLTLPGVGAVKNNWFVSARNAGGGSLVLDPLGSETIDGALTLTLSPGEGIVIITDGLQWWTLGLGQSAVFAFDYTVISLAGSGPTYTLTGSELNRVSYKFTGALTTNVTVIVPSTVQQYWVNNSTTGAFTLSLSTAGGVPVNVPQGSRGIYYSDGTQVIDADTGGISLPVNASDGGTGQTSYTIGDLLVASGVTTLSRMADIPVGNVLNAGGTGALPFYGKVDLTTSISGVLPPANGGTGVAGGYTDRFLTRGNSTGSVVSSSTLREGTDGTLLMNATTQIFPGNTNVVINSPTADTVLEFQRAGVQSGYLAANSRAMLLNYAVGQLISFGTNGVGNRMRIATTGEVGIGQVPLAGFPLALTSAGASGQRITTVSGASLSPSALQFFDGTVNAGITPLSTGALAMGTFSPHPLELWTGNVKRATIAATGEVGIGKTPVAGQLLGVAGKVQVNSLDIGAAAVTGQWGTMLWPDTSGATAFYFKNTGTQLRYGVGSTPYTGTDIFAIDQSGSVGIRTPAVSTVGLSVANGSAATPGVAVLGSGPNQGWLRLGNNVDLQGGDDYTGFKVSYGGSNLFKITSGNVILGNQAGPARAQYVNIDGVSTAGLSMRCASAAAGKSWTIGPDINSSYLVYNQANVGVYMPDGGTAWVVNSDENIKTVIEPITDAAAKVDLLRAVIGRYNTDEADVRRPFLMAQDVQAALPEAVHTSEEGVLGIAYTEVIPLLVAAIKELTARVATLEALL